LETGPMALVPLVPSPLSVANGLLMTCPMVPLVPPLPLAAETLVTGPVALVPLVVPQPLPPSPPIVNALSLPLVLGPDVLDNARERTQLTVKAEVKKRKWQDD